MSSMLPSILVPLTTLVFASIAMASLFIYIEGDYVE